MATVNKQAVAAAFGRRPAAIRNMMNCSGAAPIYCCASWRAAILRRCWMPAAAPAV